MGERVYLLEATPHNPGVGAVTVRMSSARSHGRDTVKNSQAWLPALVQPPAVSIRALGDDDLPGILEIDYGAVGVRFAPDLGNDVWSLYVWDGAAVSIWMGESGAAFGAFTKIFAGRCGPLERADANLGVLSLRGGEAAVDKDLLTATYAGTGGAEGNLAMKGVPKPYLTGLCEGVPGVLVDKVNWVWQLHGYGEVDAITAAYEGGITLGASAGNHASYAALIAASLTPSQWATSHAVGMVRLGAEPTKKIVFDARGAKDGSTYVSRVGAIASLLMKHVGVSAGSINATSASNLDTAWPHDWGFYTDAQVNAGDVIRKALTDIGGYTFPDENGQWRFGRYKALKSATALRSDRTSLPIVRSIAQRPTLSPVGRVEIGARRCWDVHDPSEISPALLDALEKLATIEEGATAGAPGGTHVGNLPVEQAALGSDTDLLETFSNYADITALERVWTLSGTGERAIVTPSGGSPGGKAFEVGNNSGNDEFTAVCKRRVPYSPEDLYEVSAELAIGTGVAAGTVFFVGVACYDGNGVNITTDAGTYGYFAAESVAQTGFGRQTVRGYLRGVAAVGAGNLVGRQANSPAAPNPCPVGTVSIAPAFLSNYAGAGNLIWHQLRLRKVEDIVPVPTGAWVATRSYRSGDEATHQGRRFSALKTNVNVAPPASATSSSTWLFVGLEAAEAGDNTLLNSGFAVDTANWSLSNVTRLSFGASDPSAYGLKFDAVVQAQQAEYALNIPIPPGRKIFVSAFMRNDTAVKPMSFYAEFYKADGATPSATPSIGANRTNTLTGVFEFFEAAIDAPTDAAFYRPGYYRNADGGSIAYVARPRASSTAAGADVTGSNVALDTRNVSGLPARFLRHGAGVVFREDFEGYAAAADILEHWESVSGSGELSFVAGESGANALRVGNNAGNDERWLVLKYPIALDMLKTYEFRIRARRAAGAGTIFTGFSGVAGDGVTLRNTSGAVSHGAQHYAVTAASPGGNTTDYFLYRGYVSGRAPGNADGSATITSPLRAESGVRYMRPMLLVNYNGAAGIGDIDFVEIVELQDYARTPGNVIRNVPIVDTSGNLRPLARGVAGGLANDGDVISFSPSWPSETLPIVLWGAGGLVYNSAWSGQSQQQDFQALGLSASGFTASLKLKQLAGTPTTRSHVASGSLGGYDRGVSKSGAFGEAWNQNYRWSGNVTVNNVWDPLDNAWLPGEATVAFYSNDGAGWVQRGTRVYSGFGGSATTVVAYSFAAALAGMDDGDSWAADAMGGGSVTSLTVSYDTATAPASTSATSSGVNAIPYTLVGAG